MTTSLMNNVARYSGELFLDVEVLEKVHCTMKWRTTPFFVRKSWLFTSKTWIQPRGTLVAYNVLGGLVPSAILM